MTSAPTTDPAAAADTLPGRVVVITNQSAGAGEESKADQIRKAFAGLGVDLEVVEAEGSELTDAARRAAAAGARVVVAAGGDGTVNAVATALVGTATPLGVLPMGTLNHFAKDAGVPLDLAEAAALIASGSARVVDHATVNGRVFLNNSSIGVYPLMVRDREHQQSRLKRSKWWAMLLAAIALFRRFPTFAVELRVAGKVMPCRTPAVLIGNNVYALDVTALGTRDALDAGTLAIYVVRTRTRWSALGLMSSALFGRLEEHDLFDVHESDELLLTVEQPSVDVSLDGEVMKLEPPLEYRIIKRTLHVIAPAP